MTTITGKVESAAGETLHGRIAFTSKSTPQFPPGIIQTNTRKVIRSDASTGEFSVQLAAGNYTVVITAAGLTTQFNIAVPEGDDTISIEDLVTSTIEALPGAAPYSIWNGTRAGHLTFSPIDNPPAPSLSVVSYPGGEGSGTVELVRYRWTYITQEGETALGSEATVDGTTIDVDQAVRVTSVASPTRVLTKTLWRWSDSESVWLKVVNVGAAVTSYDDWESEASLVARDDASRPPDFNTTAGIIYAEDGSEILYFSTSGLRVLTAATFDENLLLAQGKKLVFKNSDGSTDATAARFERFSSFSTVLHGGNNSNFTIAAHGGTLLLNLTGGAGLGIQFAGGSGSAGEVLTADGAGTCAWAAPSGGSGGGLSGVGSPEGSQAASPGATYLNTTDNGFWVKKTGAGNTGWIQLIA